MLNAVPVACARPVPLLSGLKPDAWVKIFHPRAKKPTLLIHRLSTWYCGKLRFGNAGGAGPAPRPAFVSVWAGPWNPMRVLRQV